MSARGRKQPLPLRAGTARKHQITDDRLSALASIRFTSNGDDGQAAIASDKVHVTEADAAPRAVPDLGICETSGCVCSSAIAVQWCPAVPKDDGSGLHIDHAL